MIKSHEMQHVPGSWTESNGIFLPKPGKTDNNKPNSYRTITLSPTLLKLQEKVILWHMQHDLGMEDILSKKQFGFKKGTSTETAFHKVIHKIEKRIATLGLPAECVARAKVSCIQSSRPKRQPSSMLQKNSSPSTTNK